MVGCVIGCLWFHVAFHIFAPSTPFQRFANTLGELIVTVAGEQIAFSLVWLFPALLPTLFVYGLLTRRYYRTKGHDDELRCRKCQYILRGLTEPRCPECGEAI